MTEEAKPRPKRYLLGYHYYPHPVDVRTWNEGWLSRLKGHGIDVHGIPLTINPPGPRLQWRELDRRWRRGDPELLGFYENLVATMERLKCDVFINYAGINLHPEFVEQLSTFNVFACFDDPESSENLSKPVAHAYDLCMVGNIAEVSTYQTWGKKPVEFWPIGFRETDYLASLTKEEILTRDRDVDLTILCERAYPARRERLDKISTAFPQGSFYGEGWPLGFLPEEQRIPLYQRTKVGINLHNSTGPINYRTFTLPANGVLQICDNKSHLAKIFEMGKEVVGFDNVEEAIELCRYYLHHEEERRAIAAAGFERALKDYSELSVFRVLERAVEKVMAGEAKPTCEDMPIFLRSQSKRTTLRRAIFNVGTPFRAASAFVRTLRRKLKIRTYSKSLWQRLKAQPPA